MPIDFWTISTWALYTLGGYLFTLNCYRLILSARELRGELVRLRALVQNYFPPTA